QSRSSVADSFEKRERPVGGIKSTMLHTWFDFRLRKPREQGMNSVRRPRIKKTDV
ncbi:unnamed protein product, partial [Nesidiocoris tenuis]